MLAMSLAGATYLLKLFEEKILKLFEEKTLKEFCKRDLH
jgi:hypothetical protein